VIEMMLLIGMLLIGGAIFSVHRALAGAPDARISKERLASLTVTEQRPLLTRITDGAVAHVEAVMSRRGWRPFTAMELELAGVRTPVASLVVMVTSVSVVFLAVGLLVFQSFLIGLVAAVLVPVGSKTVLNMRAGRRRKKFANQLPQALQMIAASLRAGHSISRAMEAVAQEAEAPMNEEFARVSNEARLGRDLVEALEQVSVRMGSQDFFWVAGAISAQRETGGNLNEILDRVSETIRERNHVRQQVRSLSAEGRLSAYILMALPVGIGIYYGLVSQEIMGVFIHSAIGKLLLAGSFVMYVLGGLWMRSVVRIEF
jgi:tight adherence protein B